MTGCLSLTCHMQIIGVVLISGAALSHFPMYHSNQRSQRLYSCRSFRTFLLHMQIIGVVLISGAALSHFPMYHSNQRSQRLYSCRSFRTFLLQKLILVKCCCNASNIVLQREIEKLRKGQEQYAAMKKQMEG